MVIQYSAIQPFPSTDELRYPDHYPYKDKVWYCVIFQIIINFN